MFGLKALQAAKRRATLSDIPWPNDSLLMLGDALRTGTGPLLTPDQSPEMIFQFGPQLFGVFKLVKRAGENALFSVAEGRFKELLYAFLFCGGFDHRLLVSRAGRWWFGALSVHQNVGQAAKAMSFHSVAKLEQRPSRRLGITLALVLTVQT
jgi:hypothetical protein